MQKNEVLPINVLWVIDHFCYDGSLHAGGRLYWNILPRFEPARFRIIPCVLRATDTIRRVFTSSPVPLRFLDKGKFDLTTLGTLLRLVKNEKIDVMHLHCYGAATFGRLASVITGTPSIIHDYDTGIHFPYPWYLGFADRMLAPVSQGAIAASPAVRDYLINRRRIDSSKIRVIPHAILPEKFTPVAQDTISKIRSVLGIAKDTKIIGTITRLAPDRGNEYLLEAAAKVVTSCRNVLFLVVHKVAAVNQHDEGAKAAELLTLAKRLNIARNVKLIASPDNQDELVAACDLIIVPFLSNRFSSVDLLEAMAMGRPVIATTPGDALGIIRHGINGYLVPPGRTDDLARQILEVLTHPDKLRGIKASVEGYSVDGYVQLLECWYKELAAHGDRLN